MKKLIAMLSSAFIFSLLLIEPSWAAKEEKKYEEVVNEAFKLKLVTEARQNLIGEGTGKVYKMIEDHCIALTKDRVMLNEYVTRHTPNVMAKKDPKSYYEKAYDVLKDTFSIKYSLLKRYIGKKEIVNSAMDLKHDFDIYKSYDLINLEFIDTCKKVYIDDFLKGDLLVDSSF